MADGTQPDSLVIPPAEYTARAVFLAWERLRLVYNAILTFVVLIFIPTELSDRAFRGFLFKAAVGAHLCFCLGPVAEGYLTLLGADRRIARWAVFVPGMMLGCLLAFAAMFSWRMRDFD